MTEAGGLHNQQADEGCYARQILSALAADPDRVAVYWREHAVRAGELAEVVVATVHALRELGVGVGSMVAVLVAPNRPEMLTVRYAVHLLGGAVTHVRSSNPGSSVPVLSPESRLGILLDSRATVLYTDSENRADAEELARRAAGRFTLVNVDDIRSGAPTTEPKDLGETPKQDPASLALVTFSSGSTGQPKGVCVSTLVWETTVRATIGLVREPDPRLLVATPLSFVVGPVADAVLGLSGVVGWGHASARARSRGCLVLRR